MRKLGGYRLEACLCTGATTQVYRARAPDSASPVAIKLLAPALSVHAELVAAFRDEAELSMQLRHPHLPRMLGAGMASGVPFLVMELLDGPTVAELLQRLRARGSRLPVGAALAVARDACRALGYAHHFVDASGAHRQVVHCDVSPANLVLCASGVVKLIDFGVARVAGPFDCDITASGAGRPGYLAPEQARGEPIDRRVDVYAAGVVLQEMLRGEPDVPRLVEGIVRRALAADRAQRYPSGAAMARALETLAGLVYSRLRMAELVRDLVPSQRLPDEDTAPMETSDWKETARIG